MPTQGDKKFRKGIVSVAAAAAALLGTSQADAGSWVQQLARKAADQTICRSDTDMVPQVVLEPSGESVDATDRSSHSSHRSHSSHSSHRSHSSHYSG